MMKVKVDGVFLILTCSFQETFEVTELSLLTSCIDKYSEANFYTVPFM